jgi:DNA-binding transcriptional regulator YiaG
MADSIYKDAFPQLKAGESTTRKVGGVSFRVAATGHGAFHTGRMTYQVICLTCHVEVHAGTTGPDAQARMHVRGLGEAMTGRELRVLREAIRLDPFGFAAVMGVHVSTVYRWEASGDIRAEPLQVTLFQALARRLHACIEAEAAVAGKAMIDGLRTDGALGGLMALMGFLAGQNHANLTT